MSRPERTRFRFVGGKGGAGKTTYATALALDTAAKGSHVLLVSTDPAHSLRDLLRTRLGAVPRPVAGSRQGLLDAVEMDAPAALERWLGPRRDALSAIVEEATYLDRVDVDRLLVLDVPGVDELVGLMEIDRLANGGAYEQVVVDMAPTGHALRLLAAPDTLRRLAGALDVMRAKHRYLSSTLGRPRRVDPGSPDALIRELSSQGRSLARLLRDSRRCRFTWVLLPEGMVLEETRDALASLEGAGMLVDELVVNRRRGSPPEACEPCHRRSRYERAIMRTVARSFPDVPVRSLPERETEPRGVAALSRLIGELRTHRPSPLISARRRSRGAGEKPTIDAITALAPPAKRLLLFAGKGGVGKTTAATSAALCLAATETRGGVLLLSIDPAHSLSDVLELERPLGDRPTRIPGAAGNVWGRELDASRAYAELREGYRSGVEDVFGSLRERSGLDTPFDRQALQELIDLTPPGLDEIMGMLGLVESLQGEGRAGDVDLVVVDAAPTGHALRLLEMPDTGLAWAHSMLGILLKYRDVTGLGDVASRVLSVARRLRLLRDLLTDDSRSSVILVARPAELPLTECVRLLRALETAKIDVSAMLINATTNGTCARCRRTARRERRVLRKHLPVLAASEDERPSARGRRPIFHAPAIYPPPSGVGPLTRWASGWTRLEA